MKHIVISEFMAETALNAFGCGFSVQYDPTLVNDREKLFKAVKRAHALIVRNQTIVNLDLLHEAPDLTVIGRLGVGLDNIDMAICRARKVEVLPATGANALAVAEYVLGAAFVLRRRVFSAQPSMLLGLWPRQILSDGNELFSCTMGFIGFGNIAQVVAEKAQALGMKTIAYDPYIAPNDAGWLNTRRVKKRTVFENSDIISLHVPLTAETRHLVDENMLKLMKRNAVLINTSRGSIVDEVQIVRALKSRTIGGAALDVFEHEPLKQDSAEIFSECPNLVLTPHIAGVSVEANLRVSEITVKNVKKALKKFRFK